MKILCILVVAMLGVVLSHQGYNYPNSLKWGFHANQRAKIVIGHSYVLLPAALKIGNFSSWNANSNDKECLKQIHTQHQEIQATLNMMIKANLGNILHKVIPKQTNPQSRTKRFALGAGTLLGFGLGVAGKWVYDVLTNYQTDRLIQRMETNVQKIVQSVNAINDDMILLDNEIKHIWSYSMKNRAEILSLRNMINCLEAKIQLNQYASILYSLIPNQFHRALNNLLVGQLTPDLLGYNQAMSMIINNPELSPTVYLKDISLLYRSADTIPVHVDLETATILYIIRIPYIVETNLGEVYSVTNFGYFHNTGHIRFQLPDYFAVFPSVNGAPIISEINPAGCKLMGGLWICPDQSVHDDYKVKCLHQIFSNNTVSSCRTEIKAPRFDPVVQHTGEGVFISSMKYPITLYNRTHHQTSSTVIDLGTNISTVWIPYGSFDGLVVGPYKISGDNAIKTTFNIIEVNFSKAISIKNLTVDPSDETWQPTSITDHSIHIETYENLWDLSTIGITIVSSILTSILTTSAIMLTLIYLAHKRKRNSSAHRSSRDQVSMVGVSDL